MKKRLVIILTFKCLLYADISVQEAAELEIKAAEIRKELGIHTPSAEEKRLERIRAELHLDFDTSSKDALLGNNKSETVQSLAVSHKSDSITNSISSGLSGISKTLGIEDEEEDDYSFSGTLNTFYKSVGLDEGESWGMPSIFGFNEKKKKSSLFGFEFLGGLKDTGNTIHKGMKYSGQSAEFTSGMMYKSSKMYNTMFGMYEDSPFNVFEEEEETSIFDVFEGGNKVLDIFD
jgi:hypothetical protein